MKRTLSPEAAARQHKAQVNWHRENLERISVTVPKGMRDKYKAIAKDRGISLNKLIVEYLDTLE